MSINVHIERLVLDGVSVTPGQEPRLRAALQTELARRLTEGGLSPGLLTNRTVPCVPGESMQVSGRDDPSALGREIARALYGGLTR